MSRSDWRHCALVPTSSPGLRIREADGSVLVVDGVDACQEVLAVQQREVDGNLRLLRELEVSIEAGHEATTVMLVTRS